MLCVCVAICIRWTHIGATNRTPEIDTSEVIVDFSDMFQRIVSPVDVNLMSQGHVPLNVHFITCINDIA